MDTTESFSDDGSVGGASASSSSTASGLQQAEQERRYGLDEKRIREERPWDLPTLQTFPYLKASGQWTHALPGWLVRIHGNKRSRLFHPLHRKTPKVE